MFAVRTASITRTVTSRRLREMMIQLGAIYDHTFILNTHPDVKHSAESEMQIQDEKLNIRNPMLWRYWNVDTRHLSPDPEIKSLGSI